MIVFTSGPVLEVSVLEATAVGRAVTVLVEVTGITCGTGAVAHDAGALEVFVVWIANAATSIADVVVTLVCWTTGVACETGGVGDWSVCVPCDPCAAEPGGSGLGSRASALEASAEVGT